jgi:SAM-dependent methyltransferase
VCNCLGSVRTGRDHGERTLAPPSWELRWRTAFPAAARYAAAMVSVDAEPWLPAAMSLLDVRRHDRLLAVGVPIAPARHLAARIGRDGELVLVLRDRRQAEQLAALDLEHVQVVVNDAAAGERFGTFDAMLMAPATGPLPPLGALADLARANLRPGGRFVFDLPGAPMLPELLAAARDLGWPEARLGALHGCADDVLADGLRNAGLRAVHGVLGAHLLEAGSPGDLVDAYAEALDLGDDERLQLTHAVLRRASGTGPLSVLLHRTRVAGQR